MSKFTKGPWEIETYSDGMLQIVGNLRAVDEDCDEFTTITEQVYGLANARLIAAAPCILEALEAMCAEFRAYDLLYGSEAYAQAISAINKARSAS